MVYFNLMYDLAKTTNEGSDLFARTRPLVMTGAQKEGRSPEFVCIKFLSRLRCSVYAKDRFKKVVI